MAINLKDNFLFFRLKVFCSSDKLHTIFLDPVVSEIKPTFASLVLHHLICKLILILYYSNDSCKLMPLEIYSFLWRSLKCGACNFLRDQSNVKIGLEARKLTFDPVILICFNDIVGSC